MATITPFYRSANKDFTLVNGDCVSVLEAFDFKFDMIFADPPYFLSNGGISVSSGKVVCVDKGGWDKAPSAEYIDEFNRRWLTACKDKLKDNGTIWISGTHHNIFSVADQLSELGFKILNVVTWNKTDPPDNVSHRVFKHSAEYIIWAKKSKRAQHRYNYELMRQLNDGKQMTDVWRMPAVAKWEKSCGKHPTQKPLSLLSRIVMASTKEGDWVLDPFNGSGTTGVAASLLGRKYLGIDMDLGYLELASKRREELENDEVRQAYKEMVLVDFNGAIQAEQPHHVLVGRIGSEKQWEWFEKSHTYTLPISKILSMPKLLGAEYVLAFLGKDSKRAQLCRISSVKPQVKTREQVEEMASHTSDYKPTRDKTYWLIHLEKPLDELKGKVFNKSLLLNKQEQRGAYWIKKYEEVIRAFE
ncbi:MAG: site-specific DNA-methyltransferase [Prevotella sp.]|nr:site-specific DNA-methyltransferase [Prevotella sp.]